MGTGVSPKRIATRNVIIQFFILDNSTVKHILLYFFRFSWIDSAVFTAYCIQFRFIRIDSAVFTTYCIQFRFSWIDSAVFTTYFSNIP